MTKKAKVVDLKHLLIGFIPALALGWFLLFLLDCLAGWLEFLNKVI